MIEEFFEHQLAVNNMHYESLKLHNKEILKLFDGLKEERQQLVRVVDQMNAVIGKIEKRLRALEGLE